MVTFARRIKGGYVCETNIEWLRLGDKQISNQGDILELLFYVRDGKPVLYISIVMSKTVNPLL